MNRNFKVAGLGELLWDLFPDSRRLGGAPANFAWHCQQLGADALTISKVGCDELGDEILNSFKDQSRHSRYIEQCKESDTGTE